MKYYKAFKKRMICRGKQYKENTDFEEQGGEICGRGMMHFCKTPFDTLDYYPLIDDSGNFSEFAEVEPLAEVVEDGNKCASKKIHIGAKLSFKEFIKAGVDVLIEKTKPIAGKKAQDNDNGGYGAKIGSSGDGAKIGSSGYGAQIGSSGDGAKIGSSGDGAKIGSSGDRAQIGSSGDGAKIGSSGYGAQIGSSGDRAQIGSSGDRAQIGSSGDGAQIGSSGDRAQIGSSGDMAQIGSSGYGAQIGSSGYGAQIGSSGDRAQIRMEGKRSVAAAVGHCCRIAGKKGDWIVLTEWEKDKKNVWYPACVKAAQIDGETLKEDVMYTLENGEFKAVFE